MSSSSSSSSKKNRKFVKKIDEFYSICFPSIKNKQKVILKLQKISHNLNNCQVHYFELNKIISCTVKILYICNESIYTSKKSRNHQNNYRIVQSCYNNILFLSINENTHEIIMNAIVEKIDLENLWQWRDLSYDIIDGLFKLIGYQVIEKLLNMIDMKPHNVTLIIRNLHDILKDYTWSDAEETKVIVDRLLKLYRHQIETLENLNQRPGSSIRGLEVCIRNIITNLSDNYRQIIIYQMCVWTLEMDSNDKIIVFSNILEYACIIKKSDLLEKTLNDKILQIIMKMISSSSKLVSLLGNRILQHLIDRNQNRSQFESAQIFFENVKYKIKVNNYEKSDMEFLKQHREIIHDTFVQSIIQHCSKQLNLECIYCTLCLIAVEVPCGFSAAALVCLIMNVQDLTLKMPKMERKIAYHIHAIVGSILTLICWLHSAKILYTYLNKVIMERAQWAPHLNPPLKSQYNLAVHYVLWNKKELYFVDWEIRFGLWKCFRLLDQSQSHVKTVENNKIGN